MPLANFPAFVAIPVSMVFDEADAFARLLIESGLGDFFPAFFRGLSDLRAAIFVAAGTALRTRASNACP